MILSKYGKLKDIVLYYQLKPIVNCQLGKLEYGFKRDTREIRDY